MMREAIEAHAIRVPSWAIMYLTAGTKGKRLTYKALIA